MRKPLRHSVRSLARGLAFAVVAVNVATYLACSGGGGGGSTSVAKAWGPPELLATDNYAVNPSVAMDPAGNVIAVWEAHPFPIVVEGARYSPGSGWSAPQELSTTGPDDAMVPQIALDSSGNAIVVWYQGDGVRCNIWARRYAQGAGWDNALLIESDTGDASRVAIAMNPSGNAVAVWHQFGGSYSYIWSNRYVAGSGWGTAERIETGNVGDAVDAEGGLAANGDAIAVWSQLDGLRTNIVANRYRAGIGWDNAALIETDDAGNAWEPHLAVDPSGNGVAVWSQFFGTVCNIRANRYRAGLGWDNAVSLETTHAGDSNHRPQVAVDSSGNSIAVWQQSDGMNDHIWSSRYQAVVGWDNAVRIESFAAGDATRPQVAADSSGNAIAVWQQSDGTNVTVWSNRYVPGAGWGSAQRIDTANSGSAERPSMAMDSSGNAVVVWVWNDGSTYEVRAARYR